MLTCGEVMTKNPVCRLPDDTAASAALRMSRIERGGKWPE